MSEYLFKVIDTETTDGWEVKPPENEVIAFGVTDVVFDPDTLEVRVGDPREFRFRPTRPLKPDNMAIHHLTMADLEGHPICAPYRIKECLGDGEIFGLVAHNWAFDGMFFPPDIIGSALPICTMKAAKRLWADAPNHKNQTLRYWLGLDLPADKAMPPHAAGPDSYVTAHIFGRMLKETRVNNLVQWTRMPNYIPVCPLRKHKNKPWCDVPHDYLTWIIGAPEMDEDIKLTARAEIDRRRDAHT